MLSPLFHGRWIDPVSSGSQDNCCGFLANVFLIEADRLPRNRFLLGALKMIARPCAFHPPRLQTMMELTTLSDQQAVAINGGGGHHKPHRGPHRKPIGKGHGKASIFIIEVFNMVINHDSRAQTFSGDITLIANGASNSVSDGAFLGVAF